MPSWSLAGNSFGGLVGLAYAIQYPERIKGLVLVDAHWSEAGLGDEMLQTLGLKGEQRNLKIMENFQNLLGRHSARKESPGTHG